MDLRSVPFSRYGSYLAVSRVESAGELPAGLYLRNIHGDSNRREIFLLEMTDGGRVILFQETARPQLLRLETEKGYVEICIATAKLILIRGKGVGLRFSFVGGPYANQFPEDKGQWVLNSHSNRRQYLFSPRNGLLRMDGSEVRNAYSRIGFIFEPASGTAAWEGAVEEFDNAYKTRETYPDFDETVMTIAADFQEWLSRTPDVPRRYQETRELAAYTNWSAVVAAEGHLTRDAIFMSKNKMCGIWSWDNCFNAMAHMETAPELAWDQLMLMADLQHPNGAFPDCVDDKAIYWNVCKPPIHGWTLRKMMERSRFLERNRLEEIYVPLCRWTDWWFTYRDSDGDGIPQYNHGWDSGWDNCTVFQHGLPLESPDLSAYLVLQMEVLAEIAKTLGKPDEAARWESRGEELLRRMWDHFWVDGRVVARLSGKHIIVESESLFLYLPLILGHRLPPEVRAYLVNGLKAPGRFLTDHGLATESLTSPFYQSDGYWCGPIWAPVMYILIDGLFGVGEKEMALSLAEKYCNLCMQNGFAENHDAISGEGRRDRSYTWTASVFLLLAETLGKE